MRRLLSFIAFFLLLSILSIITPTQVMAACDTFDSLEITPVTETNYTVTGHANCTSTDNTGSLDNHPQLSWSFKTDASIEGGPENITFDDEGNFTVPNVTFGQEGVWVFTLLVDRINLAGQIERTVSASEVSAPTITCGSTVKNEEERKACPKECPYAAVGDVFKCTNLPESEPPSEAPTEPPPPPPHPPCPDEYITYVEKEQPKDENGVVPSPVKTFVGCGKIYTGLGVEFETSATGFIKTLFTFLLSVSGIILVSLIIYSGFQLMTSQGDPEKIKAARERITSAIVGFIFLVFSFVMLEVIGVDILSIPGFCRDDDRECQRVTNPDTSYDEVERSRADAPDIVVPTKATDRPNGPQ